MVLKKSRKWNVCDADIYILQIQKKLQVWQSHITEIKQPIFRVKPEIIRIIKSHGF